MQAKSPFKFLDSYTREDFEIFFGRDREIEDIYSKIFQGDLLLIFGASGTGKSSLIHCGLANKFQDTDWLPINIRRGLNINTSLENHLNRIAITEVKKRDDEDYKASITHLIQSIYLDYFKPIYMIFDQFEELFIFGDRKEWMNFIELIKEILDSDIQVKFIFVIRGEYLEYLSEFEDAIPDFFNNRIRIEKMTRKNALECIEGPCKAYNIKLDPDFAENLLHQLSPELAEIELTYLQVFLDRIFKIATHEKGPEQIVFTNTILQRIGKIGDVLSEFLEEQIKEIPDSEKALAILKAFVTMQGTKKQITIEEALGFTHTIGVELNIAEVELIIQEFVKRRLLKDKDEVGRYELRHDSIAEKVFMKITQYEREMIEVQKFIDYAYDEHVKREFYLNESDLAYILPYEDRLHLKEDTQKFLLDSKKIIAKKKRSRKQLFFIVSVIVILLISSLSLLIFSMNQTSKVKKLADLAQKESKEAINQTIIAEEQRELAEDNASEARNLTLIAEEQKVNAEKQRNQAIQAQKEADQQRGIAIEEKARAEKAFEAVRINQEELLRQKAIAEVERQKAERFRMLSLAQSLGAKSLQIHDPQQKALLALQGFYFNKENNGYPYQADIYSGLYKAKINLIPVGFLTIDYQTVQIRSIVAYGSEIFTANSNGDIKRLSLKGNKLNHSSFAQTGQILHSIAISKSGKYLATGSAEGIIHLYDLESKDRIREIEAHEGSVWSIQFTRDGMGFVSSGDDKKTMYWDLEGSNQKLLFNSESVVNSLSIHPYGKLLAAGLNNGDVFTYVLDDLVTALNEQNENPYLNISDISLNAVNKLTFNHKGDILAIGEESGNIVFWDVERAEAVELFSGHTAMITDLHFSKDDRFMLSSSMDGTAMLWNLDHTNERPIIFDDHNNWVLASNFTSDGQHIITSDADGKVKAYPVGMESLAADFCQYLNRNFREEEWKKYIGEDIPYRNTCESLTLER